MHICLITLIFLHDVLYMTVIFHWLVTAPIVHDFLLHIKICKPVFKIQTSGSLIFSTPIILSTHFNALFYK